MFSSTLLLFQRTFSDKVVLQGLQSKLPKLKSEDLYHDDINRGNNSLNML